MSNFKFSAHPILYFSLCLTRQYLLKTFKFIRSQCVYTLYHLDGSHLPLPSGTHTKTVAVSSWSNRNSACVCYEVYLGPGVRTGDHADELLQGHVFWLVFLSCWLDNWISCLTPWDVGFCWVVGQGFEALQVQSWVWTSGEGLPLVWDSSGERWAPVGPCRPLPVKWVSSLRASVRKPQGTQAKGDSWAVSGFVVFIGVSGHPSMRSRPVCV